MPKAKSKKQQQAAGAALSAKRGDTDKSDLQGASVGMWRGTRMLSPATSP